MRTILVGGDGMRIVKSVVEMQAVCRELRAAGALVGFVPTMGALHEGHLSLVRQARAQCGVVVASIFVNPLQFGANEDLAKYPRTFEEDCRKLEAEGVEVLFAPEVAEMYPDGAVTTVTVAGIGDRLDGASRPGHFTGVATVVTKLFHAVGRCRAFFGLKDAAQVAVLRQMVKDLNFDVEVVGCAIVRDADGLALSSRNAYLSAEERRQALVLRRALMAMEHGVAGGERESAALIAVGMKVLAEEDGVRVDYLVVVDAGTLLPVESVAAGTLVAVAAYVGKTRLIDNFLVE
jgi:pantoate--beta-alanine ligase